MHIDPIASALHLRRVMPGIIPFLGVVASLVLASVDVVAAPLNKCVVQGSVTYQQSPCPAGEVRKPPTAQELNAAEPGRRAAAGPATPAKRTAPAASSEPGPFRCDGRTRCTQMKSCDEAKYFLAHCPGVTMDGDHDGIPCEKQWCGR